MRSMWHVEEGPNAEHRHDCRKHLNARQAAALDRQKKAAAQMRAEAQRVETCEACGSQKNPHVCSGIPDLAHQARVKAETAEMANRLREAGYQVAK